MLSLKSRSDVEGLKEMERLNSLSGMPSGISYSLAMRHEGNLKIHERASQPCYGELRKYKDTHGNDCTRPQDRRPGDLHHPFPEGTPEGIGLKFSRNPDSSLLDFVLSSASPWKAGFNRPEMIQRTYDLGQLSGLIFRSMKIDPTVLVSLLKFISRIPYKTTKYEKALAAGMTPEEALVLLTFTSGDPEKGLEMGDSYSQTATPDLRKFLNQKPNDLTGGTLRDRFDYNRPDLAKVFLGDVGEGTNVFKLLLDEAKPEVRKNSYGDTYRIFEYKSIRDVLQEKLRRL